MKISRLIVMLTTSASVFLLGCATLSGGTNETITINSVPSGATVTVDGGAVYTTPASISLSRKKEHLLTVEKAGYKKVIIAPSREFRGLSTVGGNILWLLPGVIVDAASGAMYEFEDKNFTVTLEPDVAADTPEGATQN